MAELLQVTLQLVVCHVHEIDSQPYGDVHCHLLKVEGRASFSGGRGPNSSLEMTVWSTEKTGEARNHFPRVAPKDVSAGADAPSDVLMRLTVACAGIPPLASSLEMYDRAAGFHRLFVEAPR